MFVVSLESLYIKSKKKKTHKQKCHIHLKHMFHLHCLNQKLHFFHQIPLRIHGGEGYNLPTFSSKNLPGQNHPNPMMSHGSKPRESLIQLPKGKPMGRHTGLSRPSVSKSTSSLGKRRSTGTTSPPMQVGEPSAWFSTMFEGKMACATWWNLKL